MPTFTGRPGNLNAEPETFVPMFGAGGTKYSKNVAGQLSFTGSVVGAITRVFHNLSLSIYRAVYRAYARWSTYSIVILGDQPAGYWRLGDPSTIAFDSSGFAKLGTIHGGVTPGVTGGLKDNSTAMQFDGSTGYISASLVTIQKAGWSAEAVIYPTNLSLARGQVILFNGSSTGWGFVIGTDNTANGKLYGLFQAVRWIPTTYVFTANNWYHIVMTFDGSTTIFYVNGVQVYTGTGSLPQVPAGSTMIGSDTGAQRFFQGNIQEAAIYSYVLSQQQITQHYTAMTTYPPAGFTTAFRTAQ